MHETCSALQYGVGLSSPAANLARALWIATNTFEILCGKYRDKDVFASPGSYERYGSLYVNLVIQILFLNTAIGLYEYEVRIGYAATQNRPAFTTLSTLEMERQLNHPRLERMHWLPQQLRQRYSGCLALANTLVKFP